MLLNIDKNGFGCYYGSWIKYLGSLWEIDRSSGEYLILKDIWNPDIEMSIHKNELRFCEKLA